MKCTKCSRSYKPSILITHEINCGKKDWACDQCDKIFDSYRKLNGHKSSHQPNRRGKDKSSNKITSRQKSDLRKNNHICQYCNLKFDSGPKLGGHVSRCSLRDDYSDIKQRIIQINQKTSSNPDVRLKISKSNRDFLQENPHMNPYIRNHSSKKSYPEEVFENLLYNNNILGWKYNFRYGSYLYDFAFPDIKLDVEIDGSQHKSERGLKHDKIRDEYSVSHGWKVFRIDASVIIKSSNHERIISELKEIIHLLVNCKL